MLRTDYSKFYPVSGAALNRTNKAINDGESGGSGEPPTIDDIVGLSIALGEKAEADHSHSASDITDFNSATDARISASTSIIKTTGNQTVGGTKTFSVAPVVPDGSFSVAKTTGLQNALDGKVNTPATGTANATTYLRGDGSWSTPADTNTTYPALAAAAAQTGTATTPSTISAKVLADEIDRRIDAAVAPLISRIEALEAETP